MQPGHHETGSFTCDEVVPGLWQGDFPERSTDPILFDDVVSMTAEAIPSVKVGLGGLWLHVPTWDDVVRDPETIRATARLVAARVSAGRRVLVHCAAGLNRSGIVVARALMYQGRSVSEAIALVRAARGPWALSNGDFVDWLREERAA
jgi:hypothetical protein